MEELAEKIREIILPIFEREHYYLVDVEVRGSGRNLVVAVFADTDEGITMDQITHLSREIGDVLDIEDVIPGSYRLEVSSPGVGRPLQYLWQYHKNIGRWLNVVYQEQEELKEITGLLTQVGENEIEIKTKKKQVTIPLQQIKKAKVQIKF